MIVSKPRYKWWGYVKAIIRNYPSLIGKDCFGIVVREKDAVQNAILKGGDYDTSARYKISSVGKTVFLTREEAEAALKGAK